jgi:inner membrane protein
MVAFMGLALASDLDLLFLGLQPAGTALEHRVLTHAIPFAVVVGPMVGALVGGRGFRWVGAVFGALALLSHGILDAFSSSGKAPVLFWPFSWQRVWSPWRPIPGMESYQEYFSVDAIWVYLKEGMLSVPLLIVVAWALFSPVPAGRAREPTEEPSGSPA